MGEQVVNSLLLRSRFQLELLPVKSADSVADIGKLRPVKLLRMFSLAWQLVKKILLKRPDMVYFTLTPNGKAFYRDLLFVAIMKLFCVKRVYHLHGKGAAQAASGPVAKILYSWAFRDAWVILLSPVLYEDISRIVREERCFFLPNGIPDPTSNAVPVDRNEIDRPPHILFLSNLVQSKGPLVLLEALANIHRRGVCFRSSFAGVWESQQFSETFLNFVQENDLASEVSYLGPKYGAEKERLLASADIFAFPTYYYNEAFPLVVLEGMSHALPVVSTYEGAIPDMVQDGVTGFLVRPRDVVTLADRLARLLADPELCAVMGEMGRKRFLEHFTINRFEENLSTILNSCLGR